MLAGLFMKLKKTLSKIYLTNFHQTSWAIDCLGFDIQKDSKKFLEPESFGHDVVDEGVDDGVWDIEDAGEGDGDDFGELHPASGVLSGQSQSREHYERGQSERRHQHHKGHQHHHKQLQHLKHNTSHDHNADKVT